MSRVKQVFNIPHQNEQTILKRLLCVALYDYINLHIDINISNQTKITKFLEVLLPDFNIDYLIVWLLDESNAPTKFEYMLLYNQMRVESSYIRKKLKVANTNIFKWTKPTDICLNILDNNTLLIIRNNLIRINWTKFDYNIFEKINFINEKVGE